MSADIVMQHFPEVCCVKKHKSGHMTHESVVFPGIIWRMIHLMCVQVARSNAKKPKGSLKSVPLFTSVEPVLIKTVLVLGL